jgi:hypothetical protein
MVDVTVRRESRWTSPGTTPARILDRLHPMAIEVRLFLCNEKHSFLEIPLRAAGRAEVGLPGLERKRLTSTIGLSVEAQRDTMHHAARIAPAFYT